MKKYKWEQKKSREALAFLKKFAGWVIKGRVRITSWGFWHIGEGKFGFRMYWDVDE